MTKAFLPLAVFASLTLAAPAGATEVAVTRFHTTESLGQAAPGPIAVRAGAGMEVGTLETQIWLDAVAAALTSQGFTVVPDAARVAEVSLDQEVIRTEAARSRSGVSVGVGVGSGGGGWYGRRSGVDLGVGVGFNLGGNRSGKVLDSRLAVTILAPGGAHAWEGRAEASPRTRSKDAEMRPLANEMAARLFSGFPGESGATIGAR
ncbi:hypothetical protein ACWPMX_09595 [Tsuneonella sp. HG094]